MNSSTITDAQGSAFDKHNFKDEENKDGDAESDDYEDVVDEDKVVSGEEDESVVEYRVGERDKKRQHAARESSSKYLGSNLAASTMKKYRRYQDHWKVNLSERLHVRVVIDQGLFYHGPLIISSYVFPIENRRGASGSGTTMAIKSRAKSSYFGQANSQPRRSTVTTITHTLA